MYKMKNVALIETEMRFSRIQKLNKNTQHPIKITRKNIYICTPPQI